MAAESNKLKLAVYWAASCGGCDIALLEIGERVLEVLQLADVVFWPCLADFKYAHVESYPDQAIDLCLFNGSVRNSENAAIEALLRKTSKLLVA